MLHIQMLPAVHGDCLLVEYGTDKRVYRVLIDGGVSRTYDTLRAQLLAIPPGERHLDLLVVTHVDADHIEGIVRMLTDTTLEIRIDDVWFNGYEHLNEGAPLDFGGVQGEYLSAMIQKRRLQWNGATKGRALCVPEKGPLPVFHLPGDLNLTLLSPSPTTLARMADAWEKEVRKAGLDPAHPKEALEHLVQKGKKLIARFDEDEGPDVEALATATYKGDGSPANGSSIAFLAEYQGKRILFAADAYAESWKSSEPEPGAGRYGSGAKGACFVEWRIVPSSRRRGDCANFEAPLVAGIRLQLSKQRKRSLGPRRHQKRIRVHDPVSGNERNGNTGRNRLMNNGSPCANPLGRGVRCSQINKYLETKKPLGCCSRPFVPDKQSH